MYTPPPEFDVNNKFRTPCGLITVGWSTEALELIKKEGWPLYVLFSTNDDGGLAPSIFKADPAEKDKPLPPEFLSNHEFSTPCGFMNVRWTDMSLSLLTKERQPIVMAFVCNEQHHLTPCLYFTKKLDFTL